MMVFHGNFVPDSPNEWPPYFCPILNPEEFKVIQTVVDCVLKKGDEGLTQMQALDDAELLKL